ncbi:hypothetical protein H1W00_15240 [Aeromicrobium sp. Marseille-Q0843]|uniref:Htaa domain-containing protein n=1 Tax=Aeromicrobium phoceense TaxID=2754045 RepID=A0A838XRZ3_9ACTN|nr:hypothetical protein [Aeromicrobium phoceense]MBA4609834.1 hypothetical protein [Aeromicrobium phoceense]
MIVRLLLSALLALPWLVVAAPSHAAIPSVEGPGTIRPGDTITLSGTGWTTTDGTAGSVLAFKLDEGAISTSREVRHPVTDAVIGNKTVWAAVRADADGDWEVDLPFPTTENGTGTWEAGRHSVRVLSGSMLAGDANRSELVHVDVEEEPAEPEPTPTSPTTPPPPSRCALLVPRDPHRRLGHGMGREPDRRGRRAQHPPRRLGVVDARRPRLDRGRQAQPQRDRAVHPLG